MVGRIGSKLAQLANARRQADALRELTPEEVERQQTAVAADNLAAIQRLLQPHIEEFNSCAEPSLQLALHVRPDSRPATLILKQGLFTMLTCEITPKAVVFKRRSSVYSSEDYFTLDSAPDGSLIFRNYSAAVAPPLNGSRFAEIVLMEALGLNEEPST